MEVNTQTTSAPKTIDEKSNDSGREDKDERKVGLAGEENKNTENAPSLQYLQ
jgi:hypothetical protein